MNKLITILLSLTFVFAQAQQIRYVDTDVILKKMPQYQQSIDRLNTQITQWQQDIEKKKSELDKLKSTFENEKVLYTEDQIKTKQEEIDLKDKELKEQTEKIFGASGDAVRLRQSIVKPLQDQIYNAISKICQKNKIDMIFDKNSDFTLLYSNPRFDYTNEILKELKLDDKSLKDQIKDKANNIINKNKSNSSKPSTDKAQPLKTDGVREKEEVKKIK